MKYYGQLYANKIYNLDEMDKFPERLKLQKLIQGEIENENKLITYKEIELIIKKNLQIKIILFHVDIQWSQLPG